MPRERRRGHAELDSRSPSDLGDHPLHIAGLESAMGSTGEQKITCYTRSHLKVSFQMSRASEDNARDLSFSPLPFLTSNAKGAGAKSQTALIV